MLPDPAERRRLGGVCPDHHRVVAVVDPVVPKNTYGYDASPARFWQRQFGDEGKLGRGDKGVGHWRASRGIELITC